MIDPVIGWFEIAQYNNNRVISITNLVETIWMSIYPILMKITYDQGSEFIGHQFIKFLIKMDYDKFSKPRTSGNPMSNAILEQIH